MDNLTSLEKNDLIKLILKVLKRIEAAEKEIIQLKKRVQILEP